MELIHGFKNNIPSIMAEKKISRMDLVRDLEISYDTAQKIHQGKGNFGFSLFIEVCKYLDVSLTYAMEYVGEDETESQVEE